MALSQSKKQAPVAVPKGSRSDVALNMLRSTGGPTDTERSGRVTETLDLLGQSRGVGAGHDRDA